MSQKKKQTNNKITGVTIHGDYLKYKGKYYEKLDVGSVGVDLDFDNDTLKKIRTATKLGGFINIPEFIRHVLREKMKSETVSE